MVVLTAEIFFDLQDGQHEAAAIISCLIAELNRAKQSAARDGLQAGSGGLIQNPVDPDVLSGHWWVDATDKAFTRRFEAIELDGNWHVLDHKHPEFISPTMSESDTKRSVEVWNSSSNSGPF